MQKLEIGDKYLSIQLFGGQIKLVAFKNKDKTPENRQPDYSGNGIAIWISEKKAPTVKVGNEVGL